MAKRPSSAQLKARAAFAERARLQAAQRQGTVTRRAHKQDRRRATEGRDLEERTAMPAAKRHIVLTTMTATAPSTGAAGAAVSGDSLTVRNYGREPRIITAWGTRQVAGFSQVAWPTAHDTTRGYRAGLAIGGQITLPIGQMLSVTPQEVITSTLAGSAVAGDVEQDSMLIEYDDDQGQQWITLDALERRTTKMTTIEASITGGAGPGYSGTELITSDSALLLANREYAILGASSRTAVHAIGIVGPDTGNDRIGIPGFLRYEFTSRFFPLVVGRVPVFNSGNAASTNFFIHTDENAGTFVVTWYLALLARP